MYFSMVTFVLGSTYLTFLIIQPHRLQNFVSDDTAEGCGVTGGGGWDRVGLAGAGAALGAGGATLGGLDFLPQQLQAI